eukprot:490085_1
MASSDSADEPDLKTENNGIFTLTLNGYGAECSTLDPISKSFCRYASEIQKPVLDIGCAFGVASLQALDMGASCVLSNDMEAKHLEILQKKCPKQHKNKLVLLHGKFPFDYNLGSNSIGSILCCRTMHFFTPIMMKDSVSKMYDWLVPNGKVFIVVDTAFLLQKFIPEYNKRIKLCNKDEGVILTRDEMPKYMEESLLKRLKCKHLYFMPPESLKYCFETAGFDVVFCDYMQRTDYDSSMSFSGKENIGLIATKKSNAKL